MKKVVSGVYIIQNLVNNKVYVGASRNLYDRLCMHKVQLRANRHHNAHLQSAYNLLGEESFIFDTLEECDEEFIYSQENYWCIMLNSHNREMGYNCDSTGPNGKCGVSDETRVKMSAGAEKRPVEVYTVYGQYVTSLSDLYKAGEYFNTAPANIHRKMNVLFNKKNLIDSKLTKYLVVDKLFSVDDVIFYWDTVFDAIRQNNGPYNVHDCFGNYIGSTTSRLLSSVLDVTIHSITCSVRRGSHLKTLKITI